jgi:hypothetical protein
VLSSFARKAAGAIEHRHSLHPLFSGVTDDASLGHFVPREYEVTPSPLFDS